MAKKIGFYYLTPRLHSYYKLMIKTPPRGYEFILPKNEKKTRTINFLLNSKILRKIYRNIIKKLISPDKLFDKAYSAKIDNNINLIASGGRAIDIKRPWVCFILDNPYSLGGFDYKNFIKKKKETQRRLLSPYCKKIIIGNDTAMKIMKKFFSKEVIKKCVLIRHGIEKQSFKKPNKRKVQILFMGSVANPDDFEMKGGLYVLEVFKKLNKDYDVDFIIRSKIPDWIKKKYNIKNLKIIDKEISYENIKKLYINSDIFLIPGRVYTLMTFLEAMSFELPLVCLDTYAVKDYVINNENGLIVKRNENVPYEDISYPCNVRSKEFIIADRKLNKRVIKDLCSATIKLIEDKKLREKLGVESRKMIETKFSIELRNKKLKKVFDEITNGKKIQVR